MASGTGRGNPAFPMTIQANFHPGGRIPEIHIFIGCGRGPIRRTNLFRDATFNNPAMGDTGMTGYTGNALLLVNSVGDYRIGAGRHPPVFHGVALFTDTVRHRFFDFHFFRCTVGPIKQHFPDQSTAIFKKIAQTRLLMADLALERKARQKQKLISQP